MSQPRRISQELRRMWTGEIPVSTTDLGYAAQLLDTQEAQVDKLRAALRVCREEADNITGGDATDRLYRVNILVAVRDALK